MKCGILQTPPTQKTGRAGQRTGFDIFHIILWRWSNLMYIFQDLEIIISILLSLERHHAFRSTVVVSDEQNVIIGVLSGGEHAVSESRFVVGRNKVGDHGVSLVRRDSEILNTKICQTRTLFYKNLTVFRGFIVEVCSLGNASHVQCEIPLVTFFTVEAFHSGIIPGEDELADIKRLPGGWSQNF